jgi:S-adenosylmethionine hydrolase
VAGPIVLLTDFGLADTYVGTMKGVILRLNPNATLVDLCHDVAPQDVAAGAYLLASSYRYFAPTAIFVAVVDPGVGSERRAIALETPHGTFVGPDNGLFGLVGQDFGLPALGAGGVMPLTGTDILGVTLENARYFLPRTSATFHGRDIFAPVAAHLSLGIPLSAFGPPLPDLVLGPALRPERRPGEIVGHVIHVDRFGNAITDVGAADLAQVSAPIVEVAGQHIVGLSHHYAERAGLLALIGSDNRLEIALNRGSAASALGLRLGDRVIVREPS